MVKRGDDPDWVCTYAPIGIRNLENGVRLHIDRFRELRDADFNEASSDRDRQTVDGSNGTDPASGSKPAAATTGKKEIIRPNAERNAWYYQQMNEHPAKKLREIRTEAKRKDWHLSSDQALRKAVKSHCDALGIDIPRRRQRRTKPD